VHTLPRVSVIMMQQFDIEQRWLIVEALSLEAA